MGDPCLLDFQRVSFEKSKAAPTSINTAFTLIETAFADLRCTPVARDVLQGNSNSSGSTAQANFL